MIIDHIAQVKKLLLTQYKNSTNLRKLIEIYVSELQEIEIVLNDLLTLRFIDTAFGRQLDRLGDMVGVERFGLSDEDYRKRIYAQININSSSGTPENIILAIKDIMKTEYIKYSETYPGHISIDFKSFRGDPSLVSNVKQMCLAGVDVSLIQDISNNTLFLSESILSEFDLSVTQDRVNYDLVVDSNDLEYNLELTSGKNSYIDPFLSLGEIYEEDGEEKYFKGGILKENIV